MSLFNNRYKYCVIQCLFLLCCYNNINSHDRNKNSKNSIKGISNTVKHVTTDIRSIKKIAERDLCSFKQKEYCNNPVILEVRADWCPVCINVNLLELSIQKIPECVRVAQINIDSFESSDPSIKILNNEYNTSIDCLPTILCIDQGKVIKVFKGNMDVEFFINEVKELLINNKI